MWLRLVAPSVGKAAAGGRERTVAAPLGAQRKSALFFTGDCHAAQGQGELCGVALEVSEDAAAHIRVERSLR